MAKCNANVDRLRGYRIEIYPTDEQKAIINRLMDLYRTTYNIANGILEENYKAGNKYIKRFNMNKRLSDLRKTKEYNWLNEISMSCIRQAIIDLDNAYNKFFKGLTRHPKFKSKRKAKRILGVRSDRCYIRNNYIQISGLPQGLNLVDAKNHPIPKDAIMYHTVVSFDGYQYWFSCQVEKPMVDISNIPQADIIGIDVGRHPMIATSDGSRYEFPDNKKLVKRLKRQDRRLQKDYKKYLAESMRTKTKYEDVPKSKNFEKRLKALRKTYKKMSNRNKNAMHNATKEIVSKNPQVIVIETISVRDMQKQSWFNKTNFEWPSFFEIHRQLKYKAADRGIPVISADRDFPSTKTCSRCGNIKHKVYGKTYICSICGLHIDRDLNAAINLREYGRSELNSYIEVA